jgi:hypothetical protein
MNNWGWNGNYGWGMNFGFGLNNFGWNNWYGNNWYGNNWGYPNNYNNREYSYNSSRRGSSNSNTADTNRSYNSTSRTFSNDRSSSNSRTFRETGVTLIELTIDFRRGSDRERTNGTFNRSNTNQNESYNLLAEREPIQIILEEETPLQQDRILLHLVARNESYSPNRSSSNSSRNESYSPADRALQVLVAVDHHKAAQDEVANKKTIVKIFILKTLFKKNEKYLFFLVVGFTFRDYRCIALKTT